VAIRSAKLERRGSSIARAGSCRSVLPPFRFLRQPRSPDYREPRARPSVRLAAAVQHGQKLAPREADAALVLTAERDVREKDELHTVEQVLLHVRCK
jgi:hypothetical protein